VYVVEDQGGEK